MLKLHCCVNTYSHIENGKSEKQRKDFGTFGAATMWEAVFADVGVTILVVLNALRIFMV